MSYDSKEYFERFRSQTLVEPDVLPIMRGVEDTSDTDSVEEKFPDGNFSSLITNFEKLIPTESDDQKQCLLLCNKLESRLNTKHSCDILLVGSQNFPGSWRRNFVGGKFQIIL